jgi:glycosyltransferase involved in cell wall biosynthesis
MRFSAVAFSSDGPQVVRQRSKAPPARLPPESLVMRILYLITRSEPGGAQSHLASLIEHFGPEVAAVAAGLDEENVLDEVSRTAGAEFIPVGHLLQPLHPVEDARAVLEIAKLMRRVKPDLVHIHSSKAGIVGRLAARLAGIRAVFTAHGWAFAEGASWKRKLVAVPTEFAAGRLADHIIAVSEADLRQALRFHIADAERITVVRNGIEDALYRANPGGAGEVRVVMVARFSPPKDHATLLQAMKGIKGSWRLLLVGDGPLRGDVHQLATHLGLGHRVEFLGSRHDVPEILASAHVVVLATRSEGLPISILEGMRAGLPVVATDVGGVPETIHHGENGFLVPRSDVPSLREALQRLIDDGGLRDRFGVASRARYEAEFTAQRMYEQTRAVYESVLKSRKPAR